MSGIHSVAVLSNVQLSGEKGGAEIFYQRLLEGLRQYVPDTELIEIPCSEQDFSGILRAYEMCYHLDLSRFDGVISAKAPTFAVSHPNHVCYLMHTVRAFYDMFDKKHATAEQLAQRRLIFRMDRELLSPPRTKRVFSIGQEVTDRSLRYTGVESTPLHPGMTSDGFYCASYGDYLLLPGRLHPWKRVDLAIRAMKYVKSPVKLKIAGTGSSMEALKALAKGDPRIEFLGYVEDDALRALYANALGVIFAPIREDYGYILHEAFSSEKPVITCTDSGEPARFLRDGENGYLAEPTPRSMAACIDRLCTERDRAPEMGRAGKESIASITWDRVVQTLLQALEA